MRTPRPGRFLITGSVDLFQGAISPDSLAGRVETVELLPFSQAEIGRHKASDFLRHAFAGDFPMLKATGRAADLIARVIAGGYPEALTRTTPAGRTLLKQPRVNYVQARCFEGSNISRGDHHAIGFGCRCDISIGGSNCQTCRPSFGHQLAIGL